MPKQRYRLQALLTIKAQAKKRAEVALARAIASLQRAKDKLERLKEEKRRIAERWREARAKMSERMRCGAMVGEGTVHVNFLRKLKEDEEAKQEEIEEQEGVVASCEERVAACRRAYIDASRELKIMEKHRELWEKKVREELTRREEREMDELGATIHQLRRWRGEKGVFEAE